jgi:hypothetical protein
VAEHQLDDAMSRRLRPRTGALVPYVMPGQTDLLKLVAIDRKEKRCGNGP